ncbi:hypothetical protein K1T35_26225 [Pseudonocardia sp. DSM 110487]|uniref:hypothetical protein n=1 Tax=Pseudonocardia sp. DSM 110487 TaxID=2865833 RepID=UPI001C69640E|nr:hypothetical protein [Pseudonocardia sp. DSM 110487]QYN32109.1 hypothetical protein K1T35_26225 [Pseudonocardia sp. DSM 110487]
MTPLARHAGPVAATAGTLFATTHLGLYSVMDRTDLVAMSADPAFRAANISYAATFPFLLIAIVALYERQGSAAGRAGTVGFCAAVVGTFVLGANMWFEAFAVPWLVEAVPQVLTVEKALIWQFGFYSSYLLFALGWVLFGIGCLRARIVPRALALAVLAAGVVGFWAGMPPFGVPLGLAIAAIGAWLVRAGRAVELAA